MGIYRKRRYIGYAIATIVIFALPFVQINGNQVFLLSFDRLQLHLLGVVFDMQELYILPFLLILLFVGIFLLTTMMGRVWCGWACPHTIFRVIFRDLIETKLLRLRKSIDNKQNRPNLTTPAHKAKKALALAIWLLLSLIATANLLWYFVPPSDFFAYLAQWREHLVLCAFWGALTAFLTLEIAFVAENFCIYICPYCRVQSVLYDNETKTVIYNTARGSSVYDESGNALQKSQITGECVACEKCVRVCPTHIDIRKGLQLECINCLECADACASVMGKLQKSSLIAWSSTNALARDKNGGKVRLLRAKTASYIAVLCVVVGVAFALSTGKESMLLNINRTAESYKILENGAVENHYTMLFQNTDSRAHTYYFKILDNEKISIKKPAEPFKIGAGQKAKKRVFLVANENPAQNSSDSNAPKDAIIPIKIMAYSTDDAQIHIVKESIFVYPRQ